MNTTNTLNPASHFKNIIVYTGEKIKNCPAVSLAIAILLRVKVVCEWAINKSYSIFTGKNLIQYNDPVKKRNMSALEKIYDCFSQQLNAHPQLIKGGAIITGVALLTFAAYSTVASQPGKANVLEDYRTPYPNNVSFPIRPGLLKGIKSFYVSYFNETRTNLTKFNENAISEKHLQALLKDYDMLKIILDGIRS